MKGRHTPMKRFFAALAVSPLAITLLVQPAQAADKTVFDVSDLETGAPPALVWSQFGGDTSTIHTATGQTTTVDGYVEALAPMGSGYVVQTSDWVEPIGAPIARWIGADGTPGPSTWRTYGLATSPDGEAIAIATRRGRVRVIDLDGDRVLKMPSIPSRRFGLAAHVSNGPCKEDTTSNGCTVFVNSTRYQRSWAVSSHGIVEETGLKTVTTGRDRWLGGITSYSDTGTCSVMKKGQRVQWRTCDNLFSDISPDKQHVLGLPAYADGLGPTRLDLLDLRTGAVEHTWAGGRKVHTATIFDQVWEDPTHLLVVTYQDEEFAIVRLGLDGSMEYAAPPVADVDGDQLNPFILQTR